MSVEQVYCYLMAFMAEVLRNDDEPDLPKLSQSPERDSKKVINELDQTLKEYKKQAAHPSVQNSSGVSALIENLNDELKK